MASRRVRPTHRSDGGEGRRILHVTMARLMRILRTRSNCCGPGSAASSRGLEGFRVGRALRRTAPPRLFVFGVSAWFALAPMSTVAASTRGNTAHRGSRAGVHGYRAVGDADRGPGACVARLRSGAATYHGSTGLYAAASHPGPCGDRATHGRPDTDPVSHAETGSQGKEPEGEQSRAGPGHRRVHEDRRQVYPVGDGTVHRGGDAAPHANADSHATSDSHSGGDGHARRFDIRGDADVGCVPGFVHADASPTPQPTPEPTPDPTPPPHRHPSRRPSRLQPRRPSPRRIRRRRRRPVPRLKPPVRRPATHRAPRTPRRHLSRPRPRRQHRPTTPDQARPAGRRPRHPRIRAGAPRHPRIRAALRTRHPRRTRRPGPSRLLHRIPPRHPTRRRPQPRRCRPRIRIRPRHPPQPRRSSTSLAARSTPGPPISARQRPAISP